MSDLDGPGLYSFEVVDKPEHGRISGTGNDLVYARDRGFSGQDQFTWRVSDSVGTSNVATVVVTVHE